MTGRTTGSGSGADGGAAEALAAEALAWLAGQGAPLRDFLVASGVDLGELRARAADPDFLAAVLDFLMQEDAWVLEFAAERGIDPLRVQRARAALPGGDLPHFT
ncbi:DUF3572 family protein [Frigidibacter sp. MR17.14]|uniref:DUF3572 family protein n=1 Tax=Frigidibacter sp. MR17.14 TaxID=3126509 RepID=UPI003012D0EC